MKYIIAIAMLTFSPFINAGWNELNAAVDNGTLADRYREACPTDVCFIEQITALVKLDDRVKNNTLDVSVYQQCADKYVLSNGMPDLDKIVKNGCSS